MVYDVLYDDIRIPYAITAEAIAYYGTLDENFSCTCIFGFLGKDCAGIYLTYHADVEYFEEYTFYEEDYNDQELAETENKFTEVYGVTIDLSWWLTYNLMAGFGFHKMLTVNI